MSAAAHTSGQQSAPATVTGWLFTPWIDLLFVANVCWPLVFGLGFADREGAHDGVQFWQIYFVTTPHRWITLALVFLDRRQFQQRSVAFVSVAAAVVAFCGLIRASTGTLTCLMTIDYLWNGWHFSAQHHGIFRIYGRIAEPSRTTGLLREKVVMRSFLVYVIVRIAGVTWPWEELDFWLEQLDWIALAMAGLLILLELRGWRPGAIGKLVYLTSVLLLYSALLLSVHFQQSKMVLTLATASALFHATEYLAIVSWAVPRKHGRAAGAGGLFGYLAPRWGLAMTGYLAVFGLSGWLAAQHWREWWALLNVIAAYLHYAYDGMIWRLRRPSSYGT